MINIYHLELTKSPNNEEILQEGRATRLDQAKELFKELNPQGYLPNWLATLKKPEEYIQVEEEIVDADDNFTGYILSIEGFEGVTYDERYKDIKAEKIIEIDTGAIEIYGTNFDGSKNVWILIFTDSNTIRERR